MDHVYILLFMLFGSSSVLCGRIPAPNNLTIDSRHFIHLLTWQAGPGSPAGLHYRVTFRSLTEDWKLVDRCAEVRSPLRCNLTDAFSDLDNTYYVNVTAVLGNEMSIPSTCRPFIPVSDTEPELPSVRVSPCNDSLCVYLQSPSRTLDTVYKNFNYLLNVTNEKRVQFLKKFKGLDTLDLKVVPGLQYCVSVNIIDHLRSPAAKPPVCFSKPGAVNNMDAVISAVLCLLVLVIVLSVGLLAFRRSILKTKQPLVLRSFKAPYKVQLHSWPTLETLKCISLEPMTYEDVQVNDDVDREQDDEVVAYEGRRGPEGAVSTEETSKGTKSSLSGFSEIQYEHNSNLATETLTHVPGSFLKEHTSAPDMITFPQEATSQILTTRLLDPQTSVQVLKKNDLPLHRHKTGDELEEEDKEDSDDVNFFSLILGGQNSEQQEETDKEEKMENVKIVKPEVPLFVLGPSKFAMAIQPTYSESTNKCTSYSEEEEEEDMDEEEAYSGYMMRR